MNQIDDFTLTSVIMSELIILKYDVTHVLCKYTSYWTGEFFGVKSGVSCYEKIAAPG